MKRCMRFLLPAMAATAFLSGCATYAPGYGQPYYYGAPYYGYDYGPYYGPYYVPGYYVAPSVGFGVYYSNRDHRHWEGDRDHSRNWNGERRRGSERAATPQRPSRNATATAPAGQRARRAIPAAAPRNTPRAPGGERMQSMRAEQRD